MMTKKLSFREYATVACMLFGLFFGAGNLIFPAYMGQMAGRNLWWAVLGFLITGVGLPVLSVAALGISRCEGLAELSRRVGPVYGVVFTSVLYLTIGPFFAIPRLASTSYTMGMEPLLGKQGGLWMPVIFAAVFFGIAIWFALRPSNILTWVGKILTPLFLVCLGIMIVTCILRPIASPSVVEPEGSYLNGAFFTGFLEGYNTMDVPAGLAFGIIVVTVIRDLGVTKPTDIASSTIKAGVFSGILMAVIYAAIALMGAQSRGQYPLGENGGEVLIMIARHHFGAAGTLILAATVTLACLKTAVGLLTSCGETFEMMSHGKVPYRVWVIAFTILSFLIAILGLNTIIAYSLPVLMYLYPLSISLVFLALVGRFFHNDRVVYAWTTGFTLVAAVFDLAKALPAGLKDLLHAQAAVDFAERFLPMYRLGLGWALPAFIGFVVGYLVHRLRRNRNPA